MKTKYRVRCPGHADGRRSAGTTLATTLFPLLTASLTYVSGVLLALHPLLPPSYLPPFPVLPFIPT